MEHDIVRHIFGPPESGAYPLMCRHKTNGGLFRCTRRSWRVIRGFLFCSQHARIVVNGGPK